MSAEKSPRLESVESSQRVLVRDRLQGVVLPTVEDVYQALGALLSATPEEKGGLNFNAFQSFGNTRELDEAGVDTRRLEYHLNENQIANTLYGIALGMQRRGFAEASIALGYTGNIFSSMTVDMAHDDSYGYYLSVHDDQSRRGENPDAFIARQLGREQCVVAREFHLPQSSTEREMIVNQGDILQRLSSVLTTAEQRTLLQAQFAQNFVPVDGFANYHEFVATIPLTGSLHLVVSLPGKQSQDKWRDLGNGVYAIPYTNQIPQIPEVMITLQHERDLRDYTGKQYPITDPASIHKINEISSAIVRAFDL